VAQAAKALTPSAYVAKAMKKFSPPVQAVAQAALKRLRARLPGAQEFVYDTYALTIAFGPHERPSDALFGVTLYRNHVNLGFMHGALLEDPERILQGSGTQFRHVRLVPDASVLDDPGLRALIEQAIETSDVPFDPKAKRTMSIRTAPKKKTRVVGR